MRNPALKNHANDRFGILIDPDDDIVSDEGLREAVRRNGKAVVAVYQEASYNIEKIETLTPEEFEKEWRGD